VRPALAPIQAGVGEPAPQQPNRIDLNAKSLERLRSIESEVVFIVRIWRFG
jgi:hypothetical protein